MLEENRLINYFKNISSDHLLALGVGFVVLLSIYLRSIIDIGSDTGIYLNLGKKVFLGQKYYYDFFESNFPISFYIYAVEYYLSQSLGINAILMSELVVNIVGVLSIIFSARILKKSDIYADKIIYNFLVLAFSCGYFIRPVALDIGEFGTKTSFALALLYPYISYCLSGCVTKKDLVCKGFLMGLIPCFKPHYLVFILVVEGYLFFKNRDMKFLISLDKVVMFLIGVLYLLLMLKYTPEFFEFIVPMWPKNYSAYNNLAVFMDNIFKHLSSRVGIFALAILVFTRVKMDKNDLILILFFVASSFILLVENASTIDQVAMYYAISTIFVGKCCIEFFRSKKFKFSQNKFIFGLFFLIPFFDLDLFPEAFFGVGGILNAWWFLVPIYILLEVRSCDKVIKLHARKIALLIVVSLIIAVILLINFGVWVYLSFSIFAVLLVYYLAEVKIFSRIYDSYSQILMFFLLFVFSFLLFSYVKSVSYTLFGDKIEKKDFYAYYAKSFANNMDDKVAMMAKWDSQHYPVSNYLHKDNFLKFHTLTINASHSKNGSSLFFEKDDMVKNFTYNYLFDDVINSVSNKDVKVLIISNSQEVVEKTDSCFVNPLEFYLRDSAFKKDFFDNFNFENRVLIFDTQRNSFNSSSGELEKVNKIKYDYEIYVRKAEK